MKKKREWGAYASKHLFICKSKLVCVKFVRSERKIGIINTCNFSV